MMMTDGLMEGRFSRSVCCANKYKSCDFSNNFFIVFPFFFVSPNIMYTRAPLKHGLIHRQVLLMSLRCVEYGAKVQAASSQVGGL